MVCLCHNRGCRQVIEDLTCDLCHSDCVHNQGLTKVTLPFNLVNSDHFISKSMKILQREVGKYEKGRNQVTLLLLHSTTIIILCSCILPVFVSQHRSVLIKH